MPLHLKHSLFATNCPNYCKGITCKGHVSPIALREDLCRRHTKEGWLSIKSYEDTLRTIFNLFFPTLSHGCFPETPGSIHDWKWEKRDWRWFLVIRCIVSEKSARKSVHKISAYTVGGFGVKWLMNMVWDVSLLSPPRRTCFMNTAWVAEWFPWQPQINSAPWQCHFRSFRSLFGDKYAVNAKGHCFEGVMYFFLCAWLSLYGNDLWNTPPLPDRWLFMTDVMVHLFM